jgi:hypothetical protein
VIGWTAVVFGNLIWEFLLLTVVYPEYRWGPELTHVLGWVSEYVAYLFVIVVGGLGLAFADTRAPLVQALFASLGAVGAFAVPAILVDARLLPVLGHFALEIAVFVFLFPLSVMAWSRLGWLTTRSKRTRAEAARAV